MPTNLPIIGTSAYNGYTFGVLTTTESVSGKAIWDMAGRTITHIEWTITLRTIIANTPPTTTDATIQALRRTLMAPGKAFRYEDKGFGDLVVNVGAVRDVSWGPKPQSFAWKPLASRHAVEVRWTVVVCIPECDSAAYRGIMEAVFGVTFERDKLGHTKRTFNGKLKIAMTRDGRRLGDTADNYLKRFIPSVPKKFRRVSQTETINESKDSLTIVVVDEELPSENVPPEGIVEASFSHELASGGDQKGGFFTKYNGRLTATYTVDRGVPLQAAVDYFKAAVRDRALRLQDERKVDQDDKDPAGTIYNVIPLRSSFTEENAYGVQTVRCSFGYLVVCAPSFYLTKGMFRRLPGSGNYDLWAKSMAEAWGARGHAGLTLGANDDAIIDLCLGGAPNVLKGKPRPVIAPRPNALNNKKKEPEWPYPGKDVSFVDIQTSLTLEPTDSVMRHVPLESGEARLRTPALLGGDSFATLAAVVKGSDPPLYQTRSASLPSVIFEGLAIRAGWEIAAPLLRGAFGRIAIPANGPGFGFTQVNLPFSGPIPIYLAKWRLRYFLSDQPVQLDGNGQQVGGAGGALPLPQMPRNLGIPAGVFGAGNPAMGNPVPFGGAGQGNNLFGAAPQFVGEAPIRFMAE